MSRQKIKKPEKYNREYFERKKKDKRKSKTLKKMRKFRDKQ